MLQEPSPGVNISTKKVKIIPTKFCNNVKFFPRPKDPKVQKSSNVEKVFTENI